MINILVPMAGASSLFEGMPFPKPLYEIVGKPMIEHVVTRLSGLRGDHRFHFVVNRNDCRRYFLDRTLRLLTDGNCTVIQQEAASRGAACSCLLAVEHINNDMPLLISNSDAVVDADLNAILEKLAAEGADAGVVTFPSVHPKWSYVRTDAGGDVVEAAEKRPISRNAVAGLYWFRHGRLFVQAAMESIRRNVTVDGQFFIAPSLNELILAGCKVRLSRIRERDFHSLYSPEKIDEYRRFLVGTSPERDQD